MASTHKPHPVVHTTLGSVRQDSGVYSNEER